MAILETLGTQALGMILGDTWGKQQDRYQDARQLEQQRKLQGLQIEGNKELADYSQELSYDLWKRTNYDAQRREMEKAGLNVGLMYAKGGPGGTTGGVSAGNAQGGQAPVGEMNRGMGMQLALQTAMTQAQIENVKADTALKQTEAGKKGGVDTQLVENQIEKLKAEVKNTEAQTALTNIQRSLATLQEATTELTFNEGLTKIRTETAQAVQVWETLKRNNVIGDATADDQINKIRNEVALQVLQAEVMRTGITNTQADTAVKRQAVQNMINDIAMAFQGNEQRWRELELKDRENWIKEKLATNAEAQTAFNTSTPQQIKQWLEIIPTIIGLAPQKKIGF